MSLTLHSFLLANRTEILDRSRSRLVGRDTPGPGERDLPDGLPHFLDQVVAVLAGNKSDLTAEHDRVAASATIHGGELLRRGLTIGQVVQDYGSVCQSVTELASERHTAITAEDFQTFNQCLDEAVARAVTEYERQRDRTVGGKSVEDLGGLAHEMRNLLTTAMLTFDALSRGNVGITGSTGVLLGRTLRHMRALVDRTLAKVRIEADIRTSERVVIADLIKEIEVVATFQATSHEVQLSIDAGAEDLAVDADRQILAAAVANLVQNAFKFTRRAGHVAVRVRSTGDRVFIDVQDECGGLPPGKAAELFRPFEQRGTDQTGLGLGLSISLKGVRASGGEIHVRDLPGQGCVFTIDLPRGR
jgi:signal transduction histidine kinase